MPPKSQIGFSPGPASRTFTGAVDETRPMFSLGLATEPWTTNLQQSITGDFFVPTPVPQSVTLEPPVPKVVKGNGPSLQIRQLWEGTVTHVSTDHFVATLTDKTQLT